jgi:hypothetical protein
MSKSAVFIKYDFRNTFHDCSKYGNRFYRGKPGGNITFSKSSLPINPSRLGIFIRRLKVNSTLTLRYRSDKISLILSLSISNFKYSLVLCSM